jgi:hypothetical protein
MTLLWSPEEIRAAFPYWTEAERTEFRMLGEERWRRASRDSLAMLAKHVWPRYRISRFHLMLAETLERVMHGEIKRLLLIAPPQHGKSTLTSTIFPAYWLAHRPDDPIMLASYGADLAIDKARQARQILEGDAFAELYDKIRTRDDSRAANRWHIVGHEGGMRAVGVNGPATGNPAGLGIIDDPVKDRKEAASATIRQSTFEWYDSTWFSRLWETAPQIMIMTRWHEDDLAGRILSGPEGPDWTVMRFPALAETQKDRDDANRRLYLPAGLPDPLGRAPGEALAPFRYSRAYLEKVRSSGSSYRWSSVYQGSPRPPEGDVIKREWFKTVREVPREARRIRYWDLAGTMDGGCRTAGVLMAEHEGRYYVEDVKYGQWSFGHRDKVIKQVALLDSMRYVLIDPNDPDRDPSTLPNFNTVRIFIEQEPGSTGKESVEFKVKELAGYPVHADPPTGDKDARLEPFAGQLEIGNVFLKEGRWNEDYIDELVSVPNGTFRDMGDASSGAFNKLVRPGIVLGYIYEGEDDPFEF